MADNKEVKEIKPKQSVTDMEAEIKALELEAKRLELIDLKERIDERKMKRENKDSRSKMNGTVLTQNAAQLKAAQARCNHKKGGNGAEGIIQGQGDDPQHAVLKHQFGNGDIWVRCLRCGKTWKPPIEEEYYFNENGVSVAPADGTFDQAQFDKTLREYNEAVGFQTRNVMSGSIQYRFGDGGKIFRKVMKDTTLR